MRSTLCNGRSLRIALVSATHCRHPYLSINCQPRLQLRSVKHRASESDIGETDIGDVDLEAEAEKFMKRQSELESGDTSVPILESAVGTESVPNELAKKYCQDIILVVKDLDKYREMTFGEIKLTVAIDPRTREQQPIGSENESDVTRAEMANALTEVMNGSIPNDRIALKVLWEEMMNWPGLDIDRASKQEKKDDIKEAGWRQGQARPPVGRDASERPVSLEDMLPEWIGYSYLYILSAVPLFIGIIVVTILFVNSLR